MSVCTMNTGCKEHEVMHTISTVDFLVLCYLVCAEALCRVSVEVRKDVVRGLRPSSLHDENEGRREKVEGCVDAPDLNYASL